MYISYDLPVYIVFSLTWPAYMQIYCNKRKRLLKKRVQLPGNWFRTPTWPRFHCFGTPIWPPWRHVKTLYSYLNWLYMSINLCQSPLLDIFRSKQSVIYMDNFSLFGYTLLVCKAKIYHLQLYLQVSKMIPICLLIYSSLYHYWWFFDVCKLLSIWTLLVYFNIHCYYVELKYIK